MQTRPATSQAFYAYHDNTPQSHHDSGTAQYGYTQYDDTFMTDMSTTSAWSSESYIPTPFTKNSKRRLSGNLLSRSKSVLFNPSTWSSASKQQAPAGGLDDESTYCHLSDDGIEVLAGGDKQEGKEAGKRLERSGSLSNMLKTPSRLTLRRTTSKLKLFGSETHKSNGQETPASTSAIVSQYANRDLPPLPPLPASASFSVPPEPSSATPAPAKSTKSLFSRAILRDKSSATVKQAQASAPASPVETIAPASLSSGKTPKHNWLGRLNIGRSSVKKKVRLEIPSFEPTASPSLEEKAAAELSKRDEQAIETLQALRTQQDAQPVTPTIETPPAVERLSLAVTAASVTFHGPITPGRLSPYESARPSSDYFPTQAIVTSSPYSGDLHLGRSPARSPAHLAIKASVADDTAKFSIFSAEEKRKISTRPQSDPMPFKGVAGATEALRTFLDDFEDTFRYERDSTHTSAAPTMHTFTDASLGSVKHDVTSASGTSSEGSDVPDDLQDLIDGVMTLSSTLSAGASEVEEHHQRTNTLSIASSFEGSASTAHEAIMYSSQCPSVPFEAVPAMRHSIDDGTERPSLETERPSFDEGTQGPSLDGSSAGRPSFDSGRSSFDYGEEEFRSALANVSGIEPERSYYKSMHRRNVSSVGAVSARSSLRDYLSMERPGLGDRMLEEVDEDVDLEPVPPTPGAGASARSSHLSSRIASSDRTSLSVPRFQTARTSRSSFASSSSDGISFGGSPCPTDKLQPLTAGGLLNNRHSMDVNVGNSTRVSLDLESQGRPSIDSDHSRPSFDSIRPLPSKPLASTRQTAGPLVKLSTASSLFTLSSVHSSPCPRPSFAAGGKKKLLMLTGNRLPRAPMIAAPVFKSQDGGPGTKAGKESTSPVQGRVKQLKTTWEERLSPKKDDTLSSTGSSPRYVRPLPASLGNKLEIARPQRLSSLSLSGSAIVPPDTPPPSSPSASEMSFSSGARSSVEADRRAFHSRLSSFGRKTSSHHRRQSSQLSRSSILAEPIPEETARYGPNATENFTVHNTSAAIKEEQSPISSDEPPRPLVIRKKPSIASNRLSVGLDAFQLKSAQSAIVELVRPAVQDVVIRSTEDDERDWEEIENGRQVLWAKFCNEAVSELQKSRALWPDTETSLEILDSPGSSFSSISLCSQLLTPGTPLLPCPAHSSALVSILLDSRTRFRSSATEHLIEGRASPDVPNTPELSPDSSREEILLPNNRRASEVTPPSPTPQSRAVAAMAGHGRRPSYQPRSLVLVEKHLSAAKPLSQPVMKQVLAAKDHNQSGPAAAVVPVKNATKGWKPRAPAAPQTTAAPVARSPVKKPILTPGKKYRSNATAGKRALTVYSDEVASALSERERKPTNSFLVGRTLSTRRRDAFTAARRKLEGIGAPEEQTDRSSGTSENDDLTAEFAATRRESGLLEARGSADKVEDIQASISRPKPRPSTRRTVSGLPRTMRV